MNERIKRLAEQAGAVFTDVHAVSLLDDEIEKFAELLIRQCIQAVKNVGGYNEDYHMNAIKKYFGVEE
jgi:hypothetical protein